MIFWIALCLPWALVGSGCWFVYQLIHQNGRILIRLEALEEQMEELIPHAPSGLPPGTEAPEFTLKDLGGRQWSLSDFRGQRVLLIFFQPRCGYCVKMLPELAKLNPDDEPLPLILSSGVPDENRELAERYSIRCPILIQQREELSVQYHAEATPSGCLVDEKGQIASELAIGQEAVLNLAASRSLPPLIASKGPPREHSIHTPSTSRIERNGLSVGTPAPDFRLPRLEGGELSLEEYRGRKVLLVFSDPYCGPCDTLAPDLEQAYRENPEIQVIMVSRGEVSENRKKARQHRITFPIALQKKWEISKRYAMFATPIAYLIDEEGILISDVAVGSKPILALIQNRTTEKEVVAASDTSMQCIS